MKSELLLEIQKATSTKSFVIALAGGCFLVLVTTILNYPYIEGIIDACKDNDVKYFDPSTLSCYKFWVVTDFNQPTTYLFFMLIPLIAVLPYSWSYASERKSGYITQVLTRATRESYYTSKWIAAFISGALAVSVPIALSFVAVSCMAPLSVPDIGSVIYFGVYDDCLWSDIYYNTPWLYCVLYTALIALFSGLWAAFVSFLGIFTSNKPALLIVPYLLWLAIKFICDNALVGIVRTELTPFGFLRPSGNNYTPDGAVIGIVLFACFVGSIFLAKVAKKKDVL